MPWANGEVTGVQQRSGPLRPLTCRREGRPAFTNSNSCGRAWCCGNWPSEVTSEVLVWLVRWYQSCMSKKYIEFTAGSDGPSKKITGMELVAWGDVGQCAAAVDSAKSLEDPCLVLS